MADIEPAAADEVAAAVHHAPDPHGPWRRMRRVTPRPRRWGRLQDGAIVWRLGETETPR